MQTCQIGYREYNVTGALRVVDDDTKEPVGFIPIIDIPQMSDYQWQLGALESRLSGTKYPEENTDAIMEKIKKYLLENTTDELYEKHKEKYKICYDFIYERK